MTSVPRETSASLLPDDLLDAIRARAAAYDAEGRFFSETLADLAASGYLKMLVPQRFGGAGLTLLEASRLQRRLAGADPAAALGVNMHLIITGAAGMAYARGLEAARRPLEEAARGELYAFGISEAGNDVMLFDSFTTAQPVEDGFRLTGTKIFTSMAHAWTRLVVHAKVDAPAGTETEAEPRLVFGVLERSAGVQTVDDWNAHGMRATDSCTTRLQGAHLPEANVLAFTEVGPTQDPLRFGIFGFFEILLASVYCGVAERAVQLAHDAALTRTSRTTGLLHADDPHSRWRIAEAALLMDGAVLQIEKLAHDMDLAGTAPLPAGVTDHGRRWYLQFSGLKVRVTRAALSAVDEALLASGGRHYYRGSELERLSRDVRASIYQPSSEESAHGSYAKALLGDIGSER